MIDAQPDFPAGSDDATLDALKVPALRELAKSMGIATKGINKTELKAAVKAARRPGLHAPDCPDVWTLCSEM